MESQTPAQGILINDDFGSAKRYTITCDCGSSDHEHNMWVEADDFGVSVTIYTTTTSDYWTNSSDSKVRYDIENKFLKWIDWFWKDLWYGLLTKLRLTRDIWWNGYVKYETSIILNRQQALNYAKTLENAIADVEKFREQQKTKENL